MGYWSQEYIFKNFAGAMLESENVTDVGRPYFFPKIFAGVNLFLDRAGLIPDAVDYIAEASMKKRGFIVTDPYAVRFCPRIVHAYEKRHQFQFEIWDKTEPDAPLRTVLDCAERMRQFEPDLIFALGGGSAMDTAKGAWLLYEHPEADLLNCSPLSPLNLRKKARLVAIPTTSGTGSECSPIAVIVDEENHVKMSVSGALPELVPDFALLDPTLTRGMPPELTAGTGLDALAHAIDAFLVARADELTDAIATATIQMIFKYLPRAYQDGSDHWCRAKMQKAASMAGIVLGNAGSGVSHTLGQTIGGTFRIHHGITVIMFVPYEIQIYSIASDKYLKLADLLQVRDTTSDQNTLAKLNGKIRSLMKEVGVPTSLKEAGISRSEFDENLDSLVRIAMDDPANYYNWFDMTAEQFKNVFECAYEGRDLDLGSGLWR